MKLYERSIGFQLVMCGLMALCALGQLISNVAQHSPIGLIIFFVIIFAVFLVCGAVLTQDLTRKDPHILSGEVIFVEEYRIHIRQENGKLKKIRVKKVEYPNFHLGQQVNLHWTRSWSMLLAITAKEEP
ncbi:hypothetical protein [Paenibacillus whitsoniae]|uniref:Uncharacterized protein n=1 Tax=Paenibacillus whitsoniae TaxID=2496558 RepID=A0A430J8U7_9BACL|nr:hypothetical protein [Paenibacillus whitsoniae]RTE06739.1 hypothetical protein EJQ19_22320 [Paenibacillus whitsoniae]